MQKAQFDRSKDRHVNIGTIGHVDHWQNHLTAAIYTVLAAKGSSWIKRLFLFYDNARKKKKEEYYLILSRSEYSKPKRGPLAHVDALDTLITLKTW